MWVQIAQDYRSWSSAHCRTLGNVLEEELAAEKRNIKDNKDLILDLNKQLELYRCSFSRVSKMLDDFQGVLLNPDLFNDRFWVLLASEKSKAAEKSSSEQSSPGSPFSCDKKMSTVDASPALLESGSEIWTLLVLTVMINCTNDWVLRIRYMEMTCNEINMGSRATKSNSFHWVGLADSEASTRARCTRASGSRSRKESDFSEIAENVETLCPLWSVPAKPITRSLQGAPNLLVCLDFLRAQEISHNIHLMWVYITKGKVTTLDLRFPWTA